MSRSDRLSGRVVEPGENHQARAPQAANRGADGSRPNSVRLPRRTGARQLAQLQAALSDRDLSILHTLRQMHYLTTIQLERMHFRGSGLTALAAARSCRRTLARLHESGLVVRLERRIGGVRAGSAAFVLALSPSGARLLGVTTRQRLREPGRAHLDHVLAVAEVVVRLHEEARIGVHRDVLLVQTEPACWGSFIGAYGTRALLKPDLRLTLGSDDQELHWFVEIDRGSEHRPVLARKLLTYLAAYRAGHEQATMGVFPRVLWIVPSSQRAEVLASVWRTLPGTVPGMFMTTVEDKATAILWGGPV